MRQFFWNGVYQYKYILDSIMESNQEVKQFGLFHLSFLVIFIIEVCMIKDNIYLYGSFSMKMHAFEASLP